MANVIVVGIVIRHGVTMMDIGIGAAVYGAAVLHDGCIGVLWVLLCGCLGSSFIHSFTRPRNIDMRHD
eukprot:scaffold5305_cov30-Cyclotella_meneghiniana.AAC.4